MSNETAVPALLIRATYHLHADDADAFKPIAARVAQEAKKSPGCLLFDATQNLADPTVFHLVEGWTSQETLATHSASDEFKALLKEAMALRILDRSMSLYHVSDEEHPPMPS